MFETPEKFNGENELFKTPEEERLESPFIVYEEIEDKGEKKCFVDIGGIKVETFASKEDVEEISNGILETKETVDLFKTIATHYNLRQPLILEGGTALGKSFCIDKFGELIYGKDKEIITFDCSGQTDVMELMAKWVPRTGEEDRNRWENFIKTEKGQEKLRQSYGEIEERVKTKKISEEDAENLIKEKLNKIAWEIGIKTEGGFEFQLGSIPQAMTMEGPNGKKGIICHIQELGLAQPGVVNALLRTRGYGKKLKKFFQLWENGGKKIEAGELYWLVYSTNPPEAEAGYLERNEIDPALIRASVYKKLPDELSEESVYQFSDFYFSGGEEKAKAEKESYYIPSEKQIDYQKDKEIGSYISRAIGFFHIEFSKALKQGLEKDRVQRNPITPDHLAAVADFIKYFQIENKETGFIDFPKTLNKAVEVYYLNSLASEEAKKQMRSMWSEIITGVIGPKINGKSLEEAINERVEEISVSPEEKKERFEEKFEQAKVEQDKFFEKYPGLQ